MTKDMDLDLIMMVKPNLQTQRIRIHTHQLECTDSEDEYAYYVARVFGVDESDEDFDYSHGYEYTFYEGTSYEMLNWVKENDCHKAKVRGIGYRIDTEYGNVFSGYWSPDLY